MRYSFSFFNCLNIILPMLNYYYIYCDTAYGSGIDLLLLCVVSMSMVRLESSLSHYKLLVVSLAVLAFILLAVDVGLGVYCKLLCNP